MPTYSFETLHDKEFEELVRDLLRRKLGVDLESFRSGKDQGIDLRYAKAFDPTKSIMIQAKHWYRSGLPALLRHLTTQEYLKIEKLNPARYILVTSLPLSPKNKLAVSRCLGKFVTDPSDIIGLDELNALLRDYPDVERAHYKLWLASTNVLQTILNNAVNGRSGFSRERILLKVKIFVPTKSYSTAVDILNARHVLLIKGEPGVGKTSLAESLIYTLLSDGFEVVCADESVRDAEDAYLVDKQQVFYFDDFLGSNYLELVDEKSAGSRIAKFVERVKQDKTKRIILTTRTTILNQARERLFRLSESSIPMSEFELHIQHYSRLEKAKILYNHIYFSGLPDPYVEALFTNKNYLRIIGHKNYNPRIIQFISEADNLKEVAPAEYFDFIVKNLNDPERIWQSAYENQLDGHSKLLLSTFFSIGNQVDADVLERAYSARLDYEIQKNGFCMIENPFFSRIKMLLGGFINHTKNPPNGSFYTFFNPSIADFLIGYFNRAPAEKWRFLEPAVYIEQYDFRFGPIVITSEEGERFRTLLWTKLPTLKSAGNDSVEFQKIVFMSKHFAWCEIEGACCQLFEQADISDTGYYADFKNMIKVAYLMSSGEVSRAVLVGRWDALVIQLFELSVEMDDMRAIVELFSECDISYREWLGREDHKKFVQMKADEYWGGVARDEFDEDQGIRNSFTEDEAYNAVSSFIGRMRDCNADMGLEDSHIFWSIETSDLEEIVRTNIQREERRDYEAEKYRPSAGDASGSEEEKIHNLFSR